MTDTRKPTHKRPADPVLVSAENEALRAELHGILERVLRSDDEEAKIAVAFTLREYATHPPLKQGGAS